MSSIITVVCTGNVARSAAMGILLQDARPDLQVYSAAVGAKAKRGRRMAKPMRELMAQAGFGEDAEAHRSRLLEDVPSSDLVICTAPVHLRRLQEMEDQSPHMLLDPALPDPAFGGRPAYARVWPMILDAVQNLGEVLR